MELHDWALTKEHKLGKETVYPPSPITEYCQNHLSHFHQNNTKKCRLRRNLQYRVLSIKGLVSLDFRILFFYIEI